MRVLKYRACDGDELELLVQDGDNELVLRYLKVSDPGNF
jgi:hypothetical protein